MYGGKEAPEPLEESIDETGYEGIKKEAPLCREPLSDSIARILLLVHGSCCVGIWYKFNRLQHMVLASGTTRMLHRDIHIL